MCSFRLQGFPLEEIHPWAVHAAVDANCLFAESNDAYWDYADSCTPISMPSVVKRVATDRMRSFDKLALLSTEKLNLDIPEFQASLRLQDERLCRTSIKNGEALGLEATVRVCSSMRKVGSGRTVGCVAGAGPGIEGCRFSAGDRAGGGRSENPARQRHLDGASGYRLLFVSS